MAKISAKNAAITIQDINMSTQTISSDIESYVIKNDVDAPEVSGFGDGSHNFTPGLAIFEVTLNAFWNPSTTSGAMSVLQPIVGSGVARTLTIKPDPNGKTLSGQFMLVGIEPAGSTKDAIKLGACKFVVMGGVAPTWA